MDSSSYQPVILWLKSLKRTSAGFLLLNGEVNYIEISIYYCCISNNKKEKVVAVSSCMMFNQDYEFMMIASMLKFDFAFSPMTLRSYSLT